MKKTLNFLSINIIVNIESYWRLNLEEMQSLILILYFQQEDFLFFT